MATKGSRDFVPALGFHWLTRWYDFTIRVTMPEREFRRRLIDLVHPRSGERVLEFGYGTGRNLQVLLSRFPSASVTGLDIDPRVRSIAVAGLDRCGMSVPLDLYDGGRFPYPDASFNTVFSSLVFHQLMPVEKHHALREIHRVLKPGGRLVIGDWGKPSGSRMRLAFYLVQLLDGFKTTGPNVRGAMPASMEMVGFQEVSQVDAIDTRVGTYCYYTARKRQGR